MEGEGSTVKYGYIGIILGVMQGFYKDNGTENGSYCLGFRGLGIPSVHKDSKQVYEASAQM